MKELTDETFVKEIYKKEVLVDCYAQWCGVCKMLKPKLEDLKGIEVLGLDVDKCPETSKKLGINNLPTLILYREGKEVKRGSFDLLKELK